MKRSTRLNRTLILVGLGLLLWPALLWADDLVRCRYLAASGQEIRLQLTIGSPAPASIIVIQHLPAGLAIEAATPPMQKFTLSQGEAKWLLKKPQPGVLAVTMRFVRPVQDGEVSGEVRYMSPATGAMVVVPVRP